MGTPVGNSDLPRQSRSQNRETSFRRQNTEGERERCFVLTCYMLLTRLSRLKRHIHVLLISVGFALSLCIMAMASKPIFTFGSKSSSQVKLDNLQRLEKDLTSNLECPVCLITPRTGPVPSCPAGHILCITCRESLDTCPTCRRTLGENINSLASALIDIVNHKCKFSPQGCKTKLQLSSLMAHEKICPRRVIKCPNLNCLKEVQFKNYLDHTIEDQCSSYNRQNEEENENEGPNPENPYCGLTVINSSWNNDTDEELTPDERHFISQSEAKTVLTVFIRFDHRGRKYFLHASYSKKEEHFTFYVLSAERYRHRDVKLLIRSNDGKFETSFKTKTVLIEEAPLDEDALFENRAVWILSLMSMQKFYSCKKDLPPSGRITKWLNDFKIFIAFD